MNPNDAMAALIARLRHGGRLNMVARLSFERDDRDPDAEADDNDLDRSCIPERNAVLLERLDERLDTFERDAATTRNELRTLKQVVLELYRDVYQGNVPNTQTPTLDEREDQ